MGPHQGAGAGVCGLRPGVYPSWWDSCGEGVGGNKKLTQVWKKKKRVRNQVEAFSKNVAEGGVSQRWRPESGWMLSNDPPRGWEGPSPRGRFSFSEYPHAFPLLLCYSCHFLFRKCLSLCLHLTEILWISFLPAICRVPCADTVMTRPLHSAF